MIFLTFDAENISAFNSVKKSICLYRNFLIKRETIDTSEKSVLIRNIDCICIKIFIEYSSSYLVQSVCIQIMTKGGRRLASKKNDVRYNMSHVIVKNVSIVSHLFIFIQRNKSKGGKMKLNETNHFKNDLSKNLLQMTDENNTKYFQIL